MKNIYLSSFFVFLGLLVANSMNAQKTFKADFETYESTPYVFRFGNKGKLGEYTYKPRWMYSHTVVENPVKDGNNPSSLVLEYTSMEARNYGLKFLFDTPIPIDEIETISIKIYQPENVIGRSVETAYSSNPATKHNLCIKLLSSFNTINDFREDEGILFIRDVKEHTTVNEWKEYTFEFNKSDYASHISKFTNGALGVAILPTYSADVTLKEDDRYLCYMDDLIVNKAHLPNSISEWQVEQPIIRYSDGNLLIKSKEEGKGVIEIIDLQGKTILQQSVKLNGSSFTLPLNLSQNVYLVKMEIQNKVYQEKILVTP